MNQLKLFVVLIVPTIFLFQSCAQGPASAKSAEMNMDSVKAKIVALESAYAVASNAKNVDGVAVYYAADAQSMANDEPTRTGMDAIKAGIKKDMEGDTTGTSISFVTTGVWAAGNYATETGNSITKDKAGKVVNTGKYMTLFELRDGKYIAIRDMWNRDAPKGTPMQ
ncbi:MAG: nuclear transport factor 2 family protein [Saprospiraceae bacterium]|uniref:Nuclear transport factor 2 family protein n=1 Tax=Candidatus Opimibacter skivensis TaxID=2982028 RepID=A0A9D7SVB5_9BACT|nr:nuclear transport factor 2 family protein [Candidatus Opimibacter skivensis]